MKTKLAINGGKRAIPEGTFKQWPPVDEVDEKYVLDALFICDNLWNLVVSILQYRKIQEVKF